MFGSTHRITDRYDPSEHIVVFPGDGLDLLATIPSGTIQLVVTAPLFAMGGEVLGQK
jgi:hypothetical protein